MPTMSLDHSRLQFRLPAREAHHLQPRGKEQGTAAAAALSAHRRWCWQLQAAICSALSRCWVSGLAVTQRHEWKRKLQRECEA